ncbi:MAG TPA: hypothetical protein VFH85_07585 [Gammaproteobacteria bacterium]|nr:hypothetical protein [Gammaproteobacteria bacterium]
MNDKELAEIVGRLPKSIEPRRDLWPGIEARLTPVERPTPRWLNGLAAAVLVAACTAGVFFGMNRGGPLNTSFTTASTAAANSNLVIAQNIKVVNNAIGRIRQALRTDPTSGALQDLLYRAYMERDRLTVQKTELTLLRSYTS